MLKRNAVIAAFTATTFLSAGVAFAANDQSAAQSSQQMQAQKDFRTLSKDGVKAFMDLKLGRVAIYDGHIEQAKKLISEAEAGFNKAKSDNTTFTKAADQLQGGDNAQPGAQANADQPTTTNRSVSNGKAPQDQSAGTKTANADSQQAQQWIPVDGEMSVAEDFSANPSKAAAVAEANKSLQKGDRNGATEKLKLAGVDVDVVVAVLPVQSTISTVHQAVEDMDSGKYYEASQALRQVEDSVRFDVADLSGTPKAGAAGSNNAAGENSSQHENAGSGKPGTSK